MSLSTKVSKEIPAPRERRGCSREILKHYSVLVFFGESNWGKIIDISESGMSFEFAAAPTLRERINLTLQTMACMPVPQAEGIFAHTFEAVGEIVWTREFERVAGVRFLHFGEGCREQIREWLAFEKSAAITEVSEECEEETAVAEEEALPLAPTPSDTFQASNARVLPETGVTPQSITQNLGEREPGFTPEEDETLTFDTFGTPTDEQQQKGDTERDSKSSRARLAASGVLAVLVIALGVRMIMTSAARRTDAAEGMTSSGAEPAKSTTIAHPSADSALPFQVEVLDMNGKRWLLRFAPDASKNEAAAVALKSSASPVISAAEAKPQEQKQMAAIGKSDAADKFAFIAPKAGQTGTNHLTAKTSLGEAPPISNTLETPQNEIMRGLAAGSATPAPPVQPAVGGEVQQARLIRSFPPAYPELARTTRVSGDVVVDALIDVTGKVTSVKVVSGPVLLQQAAIETVRQWKYESARLDGKAVATHLSVTVRFRLN